MSDVPHCGVVIEKSEMGEVLCQSPAIDLTSVVNPDDQAQVMAVVLCCEKHSRDLSEGKLLMFKSESNDYIAIQYQMKESSNVS